MNRGSIGNDVVIENTTQWLERAVIGLNLCPFAKAVHVKRQIRYVVSVMQDFLDFNDFLEVADGIVEELELDGILQVASFHPQFQFENTEPDDITNFTNRSPHPTLHLLREDSVERAVAAFPEELEIASANIETLEKLGHDGWNALEIPKAE
jgi:hypothetical protein